MKLLYIILVFLFSFQILGQTIITDDLSWVPSTAQTSATSPTYSGGCGGSNVFFTLSTDIENFINVDYFNQSAIPDGILVPSFTASTAVNFITITVSFNQPVQSLKVHFYELDLNNGPSYPTPHEQVVNVTPPFDSFTPTANGAFAVGNTTVSPVQNDGAGWLNWNGMSQTVSFTFKRPGVGYGLCVNKIQWTMPSNSPIDITMPIVPPLCQGDSYNIAPQITYGGSSTLDYQWSNGSTNPNLNVTSSGWYFLEVSESCAYAEDSIYVQFTDLPTITGGAVYELCGNQSVMVSNNVVNATSTEWSTGATTPTLNISNAGSYYQAVANSCGVDTLFFDVISLPAPVGALPPDIDTCNLLGTSIPITFSQSTPTNLLWSNGESTSTISVSQSGTYSVIASNSCGSNTYSINVNITDVLPFFTMPIGDVVCVDQNFSYPINPNFNGLNPSDFSFLWSTGASTPSIAVGQSGTYTLAMSNECGVHSDSVEYTFNIKPEANFQVPSSQGCDSLEVTFQNLSQNANTYYWDLGNGNTFNTSSTDPFIETFTSSAEVQLIAENQVCADTMLLQIEINSCGCTDPLALNYNSNADFNDGSCEYLELIFFIPNSFTPDGDENNQTFIPVFTEGFDTYDYVLYIYDRWGELIFESHDPTIGWDGTYKGLLAQDGTYTWKVEFKYYVNAEHVSKVGHLTLLR